MGKPTQKKTRPPLQLTLSEAAAKIQRELALLPALAEGESASSAIFSVKQLIALIDCCVLPLKDQGHFFAAIGGPSDAVAVLGHSYESAHHAAIGEAKCFLDQLWFHVDKSGYKRLRDSLLAESQTAINEGRAHDESPPDLTAGWAKLNNSTGMDPDTISAKWDRAKKVISELLPLEWQRDFAAIGTRLLRERAAIQASAKSNDDRLTGLTPVMSKAQAAKLLNGGTTPANPTEFIDGLVRKGLLTQPVGSGQQWRFKANELPQPSKT